MPQKTRLLSTRAVAERYSYTPQGIRELVALGVLHPVRLTPRGHYRFREEEVERLTSDERRLTSDERKVPA